ncbi:serine/threonine-protein kinase pim-2-like [Anneissia japonica]|uniref:serine/threonine-protein kinase pim-2-like n=1 Tax=Anneissia japonica TaxID=1529436 RepID=UPI001425A0DE|nr:serine/threonine-protein kinase pim-2-like [Anneissia japonica]
MGKSKELAEKLQKDLDEMHQSKRAMLNEMDRLRARAEAVESYGHPPPTAPDHLGLGRVAAGVEVDAANKELDRVKKERDFLMQQIDIIRNDCSSSIPKERCRCFFRQIVDACVGCLKRNVVHGDLKMENVIVDLDTDRIKLVDFGFAKFVDDQPIASAFGTTDHYLPPEMLKQRFMYAVPAMIWSLGIMLFEMITGEEVERGRRRTCR